MQTLLIVFTGTLWDAVLHPDEVQVLKYRTCAQNVQTLLIVLTLWDAVLHPDEVQVLSSTRYVRPCPHPLKVYACLAQTFEI